MSPTNTTTAEERALQDLLKDPTNQLCADCGTRGPRWASYTLGVFLCIRCGGLHRRIGTHVSRIKSITLDKWSMEQVAFMRTWGNVRANAKFAPASVQLRIPTESEGEMEQFIKDKYERMLFMDPASKSRFKIGTTTTASATTASATTSSMPPKTINTSFSSGVSADRLAYALTVMADMGFVDTARNTRALQETKGDIHLAVSLLAGSPTATSAASPMPTLAKSGSIAGASATRQPSTNSTAGDFFGEFASAAVAEGRQAVVAAVTNSARSTSVNDPFGKFELNELSSVFTAPAAPKQIPTAAIMSLFSNSNTSGSHPALNGSVVAGNGWATPSGNTEFQQHQQPPSSRQQWSGFGQADPFQSASRPSSIQQQQEHSWQQQQQQQQANMFQQQTNPFATSTQPFTTSTRDASLSSNTNPFSQSSTTSNSTQPQMTNDAFASLMPSNWSSTGTGGLGTVTSGCASNPFAQVTQQPAAGYQRHEANQDPFRF